MNNSYNYSDFDGIRLAANNELDHYSSEPTLKQVSTASQESAIDKHIENMLLSHSKYYVYCE